MAPTPPSAPSVPAEPGRSSTDRRRLLTAALGFARLRDEDPALRVLRGWLDSWSGIGRVADGMARQGFDLSLTRYDGLGWRATFYPAGREHSATWAAGSAFQATPFAAVQVAALQCLLL